MSRSSILNFESLRGVRMRLPATLLAVAGLVLALELTVRLWPEQKLMPVQSQMGEIFFMEQQVLPKFNAPKIVFLGSSRIRRAIVPKLLDQKLNLPEGSTINLGLAMARVYESLFFYERNQEKLKHAKVVVFNTDEWHLSTGPRMKNALYEIHGPLLERLRFPEEQRTRLFMDGLLNQRLELQLIPGALFGRKHDEQTLALDENKQVLAPARADKKFTGSYKEVETFYHNFNVHPVMVGHIRHLAELVRANGSQFVLMQLPNRASYQAQVQSTHSEDFAAERVALVNLAKELHVPLHFYLLPEELGLSDNDYEDYGHLKPAGARIVTEKIAEWPEFK